MNEPIRKLLDLDESAQRLNIHRRSVERLIATGKLCSVQIGRRRLIEERDLETFIEALKGSASR